MVEFSNFLIGILILILNVIFFSQHIFIGEKLKIIDQNILNKSSEKIFLVGGIGVFLNLLLVFFVIDKSELVGISFLAGSSIFFFLGFLDDKYNLNANLKLIIIILTIFSLLSLDNQLVIKSLYLSLFDYSVSTNYLAIPFTVLCFALYLNAFNMFDGINLQSGIYSIILCIYFFLISSNLIFLILIICLSSFLYFNFKNKIFLGDSGSLLLGFVFSFFFVKFYNTGLIQNIDEIFILMIFPGIDMFRLFCQRIYKNKNPFKKDNKHIHHLINKKISSIKTVLLIQIIFLLCIFLYNLTNLLISLLFFMTFYTYTLIKFK